MKDNMFITSKQPRTPRLTAKEKKKINQDIRAEKQRIRCFVANWRTGPCKRCSNEQKCKEDNKLLKEAEHDSESN